MCVRLLKACAAGADPGDFWKRLHVSRIRKDLRNLQTGRVTGRRDWKGDRAEGLEGKFSVLSFKMSPPCHFSFWPMFFNFPDPLEVSPTRCNHSNCLTVNG